FWRLGHACAVKCLGEDLNFSAQRSVAAGGGWACSRFSQVPQGLVAVTLEVPFEPVLLRPLPALGRHPRLFRMPATRPRSGFLRAGRGQGPLIWGRGQVIITTMAFEPRGGPSGALSPVPMPAARGLKPGHVAATWPPRVGGCGLQPMVEWSVDRWTKPLRDGLRSCSWTTI